MNENFIAQMGVGIFFLVYILLAIYYVRYYRKLEKAYSEADLKWPAVSREQMLEDGIAKGIFRTFKSSFQLWTIILFSRPNNPSLREPLKGIRRTLILFILFPFMIGALLLVAITFIGEV